MTCWALVPIKERSACKTRLDPILSPPTRLLLVRRLLAHVLETLRNTAAIDHIALVSPERDDVAGEVELLGGACSGLNADLTLALGEAAARGARRAVILPADLPLLTPTDVHALLESYDEVDPPAAVGGPPNQSEHSVGPSVATVVAPDRHGHGTNALCLALPPPFKLAFGPDSFMRHLAAIRSNGNEPAVVRSEGLSFDVDGVEDLRVLLRYPLWVTLLAELRPIAASVDSAHLDL